MRRRLEWIAPIFLIALLVQVFAPVAAGIVMAAATDPLGSAPICSEMAGDHQQGPTDRQHHPADCCIFCAFAQAAFLASDARVTISASDASPRRISLGSFNPIPPTQRITHSAQARAPPSFS